MKNEMRPQRLLIDNGFIGEVGVLGHVATLVLLHLRASLVEVEKSFRTLLDGIEPRKKLAEKERGASQ